MTKEQAQILRTEAPALCAFSEGRTRGLHPAALLHFAADALQALCDDLNYQQTDPDPNTVILEAACNIARRKANRIAKFQPLNGKDTTP